MAKVALAEYNFFGSLVLYLKKKKKKSHVNFAIYFLTIQICFNLGTMLLKPHTSK